MLKSIVISTVYLLSVGLSASNSVRDKTVLEIARMNGNYKIFISLVEQVGLKQTLDKARNVTVFAPSDDAFRAVDADTLNFLTSNREVLKQVLLYHVSPVRLRARDISKENEVKTLAGKTVLVDASQDIVLNKQARVVKANIRNKNGMLHLIDSVLTFNDSTPDNDIVTADFVDLERYLGEWYEIARYDNSFQTDCQGTRATYGTRGRFITVRNDCQKADGSTTGGSALATVVNKDTNAELEVSFVPILNYFGLFAGDYNILAVGQDYEYALVGSKSRSTFWILSRSRTMSDHKLNQLIDMAVANGYRRELIKKRPTWKL